MSLEEYCMSLKRCLVRIFKLEKYGISGKKGVFCSKSKKAIKRESILSVLVFLRDWAFLLRLVARGLKRKSWNGKEVKNFSRL